MDGGGALSFKVILSMPNVECLSVTVGCLCTPAPQEGPACVSLCQEGPGTGAGAGGADADVGGAGVLLNAPGGERDGAERGPGDVPRDGSKTGWGGVDTLKPGTVKGGGPGGGPGGGA